MAIIAELLIIVVATIASKLGFEKVLDGLEKKTRDREDDYYAQREFVICPKCGASTSLSDDERDLVLFDCLNCGIRWSDYPTHHKIHGKHGKT